MTELPDSHQDAGGIRCRDAAELVCEARDRKLVPDERVALDAHLAVCPYCKVASRQFAALFEQLDELLGKTQSRPD